MTIYERIDENKKAIDTVRPFEGEILRQLREYYRIGLTWTSNALEGNSLTEIETKVLLKFVTIHPFIDGNGRVARLLMNAALIQDGYMLAIVPPILRLDYLAAIRRYQQEGTDEQFCRLIAERVLESEKEIMRLLHITIQNLCV